MSRSLRRRHRAALVQLVRRDRLQVGGKLTSASVFDATLEGSVIGVGEYDDRQGWIRGEGRSIAKAMPVIDFTDPMTPRDDLDKILIE